MAVYTQQDIGSTLEGDVQLSSAGDLQLANPLNTFKSLANFLLRTDFGDYSPDTTIGCNLGSFVGELNTSDNREFMEYNITSVLRERLFSIADVEATVVPFDLNEVLCVVNIGGYYLLDGIIQTIKGETLTYTFPYIDGTHITPITTN